MTSSKVEAEVGRSTLRGPLRTMARAIIRRIAVHENVTYGDAFRVGRGAIVSSPHGLDIGHFVSIGPRSIVQVDGSIGDFALIGMNVQIVGREDHRIKEVGSPFVYATWVADRSAEPRDRVDLGMDVWIGGGATVLGGVTVGQGACVAAGAVVVSDVPEYSVVAGNPARVVSRRFDESEIAIHRAALDELIGKRRP